jgi:hypothetical protein
MPGAGAKAVDATARACAAGPRLPGRRAVEGTKAEKPAAAAEAPAAGRLRAARPPDGGWGCPTGTALGVREVRLAGAGGNGSMVSNERRAVEEGASRNPTDGRELAERLWSIPSRNNPPNASNEVRVSCARPQGPLRVQGHWGRYLNRTSGRNGSERKHNEDP